MRFCIRCAALLTAYAVGCLAAWEFLVFQEPRQVLGEACWPTSFSKDGKLVATYKRWPRTTPSGSRTEEATGPIEIWDLDNGTAVASFLARENRIRHDAVLSPDGRWVAVAEGVQPKHGEPPPPPGKLHVFEVGSGKERIAIDFPRDSWPFLRFSPDGQWFAFSATLGKAGVTIWRLGQEQPALVLPDANAPFAFAPDGNHIAACVSEHLDGKPSKHQIKLFDLVRGESRRRYDARRGSPSAYLAFSPDGAFLCADCFEAKPGIAPYEAVVAWEVETGREVCWIEAASHPRFLADGRTFAACGVSQYVLFDTITWEERSLPSGPSDALAVRSAPGLSSNLVAVIHHVRNEPNPLLKWLGIKDAQFPRHSEIIEVRNGTTGAHLAEISCSGSSLVFLTPDDKTLLISRQGRLEIWDVDSPWGLRASVIVVLTAGLAIGIWLLRPRRPHPAIARVAPADSPK